MQNKTDKGTLLVSKSLPVANSNSVNRLFSARKKKCYVLRHGLVAHHLRRECVALRNNKFVAAIGIGGCATRCTLNKDGDIGQGVTLVITHNATNLHACRGFRSHCRDTHDER